MSEAVESATDVAHGIIFYNDDGEQAGIFLGSSNPDIEVPDAPISSIYLRTDGKVFTRKQDTGLGEPVDWEEGTGGSVGGSQTVPFCLSDGSPSNISLISGQMPFYLSDGTPSFIGIA